MHDDDDQDGALCANAVVACSAHPCHHTARGWVRQHWLCPTAHWQRACAGAAAQWTTPAANLCSTASPQALRYTAHTRRYTPTHADTHRHTPTHTDLSFVACTCLVLSLEQHMWAGAEGAAGTFQRIPQRLDQRRRPCPRALYCPTASPWLQHLDGDSPAAAAGRVGGTACRGTWRSTRPTPGLDTCSAGPGSALSIQAGLPRAAYRCGGCACKRCLQAARRAAGVICGASNGYNVQVVVIVRNVVVLHRWWWIRGAWSSCCVSV